MLIGRTSELEALQEALADVRRRRSGACVAITGALGLGKSRMLAELAARADVVFSGRGSEFETGVPYGPVIDAFDDHLRAQGRALDDVLGATLDAERFEAHRAVRVLLEDLAPAVLALDDLHWADAATIELVCHLLRHPPAAPVLMAIAYRPVSGVLAAAVQRACRDGTCRRLELQPLSADEARALVGEADERIVAESAGNPFFLLQLARGGDGVAGGARERVRRARPRRPAAARRRRRRGRAVRDRPGGGGRGARGPARRRSTRCVAADLVRATENPRRLRVPPPAGPAHRLRRGRRRLAARRAPARGRGAARAGSAAERAGRPRRALGAARRRAGARDADPGRRGDGIALAGDRRALVHRGARAPATTTTSGGRAARGPGRGAGRRRSAERGLRRARRGRRRAPARRPRAARPGRRLHRAARSTRSAARARRARCSSARWPSCPTGARARRCCSSSSSPATTCWPRTSPGSAGTPRPRSSSPTTRCWRRRPGPASPTRTRARARSPPPRVPPTGPRRWSTASTTETARRCSRRSGGWRPPRTCSSAGTPASATPSAACAWRAPSASATSSSR